MHHAKICQPTYGIEFIKYTFRQSGSRHFVSRSDNMTSIHANSDTLRIFQQIANNCEVRKVITQICSRACCGLKACDGSPAESVGMYRIQ